MNQQNSNNPYGSKIVSKSLKEEVDREPTAGHVLARVIRLERCFEKLSKQKLDDILEPPAPAPSEPQQQPQQPQQAS